MPDFQYVGALIKIKIIEIGVFVHRILTHNVSSENVDIGKFWTSICHNCIFGFSILAKKTVC